jgi:hypothetical protein
MAQSCWDASNLKYGSFLHSPLMDELQAVEEQLNSQVRACSLRSRESWSSPALALQNTVCRLLLGLGGCTVIWVDHTQMPPLCNCA